MILRVLSLLVAGAGGYALLKGWPEGLPVLLKACLAVLLLLGGLVFLATGGKKEKTPEAQGGRKPLWLDYLAIGMGILALECGFLWLLSAAPEPLERMATRLEMRHQMDDAADMVEPEATRTGEGNWLWDDEGRRPLPRRTNLKPGENPEVFVKVANAEDAALLLRRQVHVSSFVMTDYTDGVWSADEGEATSLSADSEGWIRFSGEADGRNFA